MAESEAREWVLFWVKDLHWRAGSKRFWEEEQERIDFSDMLFSSVLQHSGSRAQNTLERCATPTHPWPVQRNTSWPNISLLFLNWFSLSVWATAYGTFLTFADIIETSNLDPSSVFLCSFDISSLFSDVPLAETIQICADALYSSEPAPAPFPRQIFFELKEMATLSIDFGLNDIMHRQIDGAALGSPLGPALANIFVGYYESKLF